MGLPLPKTGTPYNITQESCELWGWLAFDGDLPTTLWFEWQVARMFDKSIKSTNKTYNHSTGDAKTEVIFHLNYPNKYNYRLIAENADGRVYGQWTDFWGMRGRASAPGAPFFVQSYSYQWCDDYKIFWCKTDIGCHLTAHILHGWSPMIRGFHKKAGAWFRHDPGHTYKTKGIVEQMEIGDTREHTFFIYFPLEPGRRYWYLTGTVNDELSPSATPLFYEFRRYWKTEQRCDLFRTYPNVDNTHYQLAMSFRTMSEFELSGIRMKMLFDFEWATKDDWLISIWEATSQGKPINIPLREWSFHLDWNYHEGWKTYWWHFKSIPVKRHDNYALVFTKQLPRSTFTVPNWGIEVAESWYPCYISRYVWGRYGPDYNWIGPVTTSYVRFGLCSGPEDSPTGHEILFPPQPQDWWE